MLQKQQQKKEPRLTKIQHNTKTEQQKILLSKYPTNHKNKHTKHPELTTTTMSYSFKSWKKERHWDRQSKYKTQVQG